MYLVIKWSCSQIFLIRWFCDSGHRMHTRICNVFEINWNVPFPNTNRLVIWCCDKTTVIIDKCYGVYWIQMPIVLLKIQWIKLMIVNHDLTWQIFPERVSQHETFLSLHPARNKCCLFSSGLNLRQYGIFLFVSLVTHWPVSVSHSLINLSYDPVMNCFPSREKSSVLTP